jgi:hypothetical protein
MNNWFQGGKGSVQQVLPLGTGSVTTQTKVIGVMPKKGLVKEIRFHGQGAVTGTTITAEVFARTTAGATGATLQSAARDIKFGSVEAAKAGVTASLTATAPNRMLAEGQLLEVVVTASSITAGPGDFLIEIEFEPRT